MKRAKLHQKVPTSPLFTSKLTNWQLINFTRLRNDAGHVCLSFFLKTRCCRYLLTHTWWSIKLAYKCANLIWHNLPRHGGWRTTWRKFSAPKPSPPPSQCQVTETQDKCRIMATRYVCRLTFTEHWREVASWAVHGSLSSTLGRCCGIVSHYYFYLSFQINCWL